MFNQQRYEEYNRVYYSDINEYRINKQYLDNPTIFIVEY